MPATMEQTKIDQLNAVTFDQDNSVINVTVTLTPGAVPGTFSHQVPSISVAGAANSFFTVNWTLDTTGLPGVTFKQGGGLLLPKPGTQTPGGVDNILINHDLPPDQRRLTFTNNVSDVNVIRYDFELVDSAGHQLTKAAEIIIIDPTIAVVKEPVDPGAG
jgi:hypothetical protein